MAFPHAAGPEAVVKSLESDLARGLSQDQIAERLERWGPNEFLAKPPPPAWRRFLAHFNELVVWILLAAALIAFALREWTDGVAILAIVLLNAIIGFLQESRAERSLAALRGLSAPSARVVRGGELQTVPARELVPGDRVLLEAGDNVPADLRLLDASRLQVQEAALTGESLPVEKDPQAVLDPQTPIGDRLNMVYLGTVAAAGKASAVVTATGMRTELGRIAGLLAREEPQPTPLQRRLAELGRVLIAVCLVLVAAIFGVSLLRGGRLLEVFLVSVSVAVAAVPEVLPAVVTLALALGLQRMVKRHGLVRKLPSVETLGSVTVICSDKTGTLTRNEMTVRRIVAGGESYAVTGAGYAARGGFFRIPAAEGPPPAVEEPGEPVDPHRDPDLLQALLVDARCNDASVRPGGKGAGAWQVIG